MNQLPPPLRPLAAYNQFCLYFTKPSAKNPDKADKYPCDYLGKPANAHDRSIWMTAETALGWANHYGGTFGVAFVLAESDPFFFVDIDSCLQADGTWSALALGLLAAFPQCAKEVSGSRRGLHILGTGTAPEHACRRDDLGLEFYTSQRFVALTGINAVGDAGAAAPAGALEWLVDNYFPLKGARAVGAEWTTEPCAEWAGPEDDDELIRRALNSASAASVFNGRASFADLWSANASILATCYPSDNDTWNGSSADSALASHLAFWTGRDCERIRRLMERSALVRSKWEREDYMQSTILNACSVNKEVLKDKPQAEPVHVANGITSMPGTEDALALLFAQRHANDFRWTPGLGWLVNCGPCWEPDASKKRFTAVRNLCREQQPFGGGTKLYSAKTVPAVLELASVDMVTLMNQWNRDLYALNTPAGVVDLKTGQLRPHGPGDLFTQITAVSPDPAMPTPHWDAFMQDITCGNPELAAFLLRSLGYWLTGDRTEQKFHFFFGEGSNGKSTLLDMVMYVMGEYAVTMPSHALLEQRSEQHPTVLAMLQGKRLAVSSELPEGAFFNEVLIKGLTGDATLTARRMRQDYFEFAMSQKHVIVGNFKPRLRGGDQAMTRRLLLVPFNAQFQGANRNDGLLARLKSEAPGVMAKMTQGALEWQRIRLSPPAPVTDASLEYSAEHDDVATWLGERCTCNAGETAAGLLYSDFRCWKESRGERAQSLTLWGARMERAGQTKRRIAGIVKYPVSLRTGFT